MLRELLTEFIVDAGLMSRAVTAAKSRESWSQAGFTTW